MSQISATFGKADITPAEPVYLMGYSSRDQKSKGIFSPIYVSALKLSQPETSNLPLFILTYDLGWFGRKEVDALRVALVKTFSFDHRQLFIACSHTHYAPAVDSSTSPLINPEYLELVIEKTMVVIHQCQDSIPIPVSLWYGTGKTDVGINRRKLNKWIKKVELRPNIKGVYDEKIQILGLKGQEGTWHSVIFKVSCHPVGTPAEDYLIHGSWPLEASKLLSQKYQGAVNFQFFNGTAGDVRPRNLAHRGRFKKGSTSLEMMDQAKQVAEEVVDTLENRMNIIKSVNLKFKLAKISLSTPQMYSNTEILNMSKNSSNLGKKGWAQHLVSRYISKNVPIPQSVALSIHVLEINPEFRIIGFGGEICTGIGTNLLSAISGETMVVGYCNFTIGYIPTSTIIHEDITLKQKGYEGYGSIFFYDLPSPFTEKIDEEVITGISELIKEI